MAIDESDNDSERDCSPGDKPERPAKSFIASIRLIAAFDEKALILQLWCRTPKSWAQGMTNSRSRISSCRSSLDLVRLNEDENIKDPFERGEDVDVVKVKLLSLFRFLEIDGVDSGDSGLYAWSTCSDFVLFTWFKSMDIRAIENPDVFTPVLSHGSRRGRTPRPFERRLSLRRPKNSFWTFPDLSLVLALAAFLNVLRHLSLCI